MKKLGKLIKKEIDNVLKRPLYVFDFDETLAHNKGGVRIQSSDGSNRPLTQEEYYVYKLKQGETINLDDYSDINNLTPNLLHLALLKKHIPNAVVLSARTPDTMEQAVEYLALLDISIPSFGVGIEDDTDTHVIGNALRKAEWISQQIQSKDLTYVEFWDDNPANIHAVEALRKEMPEVVILTHLVNVID